MTGRTQDPQLVRIPESRERNSRDVATLIDRVVFRLAKHWLALVGLFWGLYVGLPLLAPVLMDVGWRVPAQVIYTLYRPACHQRPERSFFVGGPQAVYSMEELAAAGVDLDPLARAIGNESVGWKVAFCQRDVAIYGAIFLSGLAFGLLRRWRRTWQMPLRYYLLFLIPMGVDGTLQLFGLYTSTWVMRAITGVIFGVGTVLFAYPYLEDGFSEVRQSIHNRLQRE
jgi:uncharacterized membrane protein